MVDMPKMIRVGYQDFAIEAWPAAIAQASDRLGECDKLNNILRVSDSLNDRTAANTLLHEIMHACWYVAGLDDRAGEERVVTCLSNQMAQVWRDNPGLVAFISEKMAD